jgi:hypothetical protein
VLLRLLIEPLTQKIVSGLFSSGIIKICAKKDFKTNSALRQSSSVLNPLVHNLSGIKTEEVR